MKWKHKILFSTIYIIFPVIDFSIFLYPHLILNLLPCFSLFRISWAGESTRSIAGMENYSRFHSVYLLNLNLMDFILIFF